MTPYGAPSESDSSVLDKVLGRPFHRYLFGNYFSFPTSGIDRLGKENASCRKNRRFLFASREEKFERRGMPYRLNVSHCELFSARKEKDGDPEYDL
jgi:hypothetical protein